MDKEELKECINNFIDQTNFNEISDESLDDALAYIKIFIRHMRDKEKSKTFMDESQPELKVDQDLQALKDLRDNWIVFRSR